MMPFTYQCQVGGTEAMDPHKPRGSFLFERKSVSVKLIQSAKVGIVLKTAVWRSPTSPESRHRSSQTQSFSMPIILRQTLFALMFYFLTTITSLTKIYVSIVYHATGHVRWTVLTPRAHHALPTGIVVPSNERSQHNKDAARKF